jgi:hypothetical protein
MKKVLNEWRKYLKEGLETPEEKPRPGYSSVELNTDSKIEQPTSHEKLMQNSQILEKMKELGFQNIKCGTSDCAHHMTINMGPLKPEYGWEDGDSAELIATHLGWVDDEAGRAMAVLIKPPAGKSSKNPNPHVTVAIPEDGKPFHSNKIKNWDLELEEPIKLTGTVVGGAEQQKKQKEPKPQQKKKGPNPRAMAIGMARGGKTPEEIQAQIKRSTGINLSVDNIIKMVG